MGATNVPIFHHRRTRSVFLWSSSWGPLTGSPILQRWRSSVETSCLQDQCAKIHDVPQQNLNQNGLQWRRTWWDELCFTIVFHKLSRQFYVWKKLKDAFNPQGLLPTVKHGGSLLVWSLSAMIALRGHITAKEYEVILQDQVVQTPSCNDVSTFQDDNAFKITAKQIQEWFHEQQDSVNAFLCPPITPDLNINDLFMVHSGEQSGAYFNLLHPSKNWRLSFLKERSNISLHCDSGLVWQHSK